MGAAKSKPLGPTVAGIFAGLLLLSSVLIAVLALPDALRERRAYEHAPVCTSGRPTEDCRRHVKAAVVGKERRGKGKGYSYRLRFSHDGRTTQPVRTKGTSGGAVYKAAEVGDTVTLIYWRDLIREVTFRELRQGTIHDPVTGYHPPLAFLFMMLSGSGALAVIARGGATWARVRNHWRVTIPAASFVALAAASAFIPMATDSFTAAVATYVAVGAGIAAVALIRASVQRSRERTPSPTLPVHPQVPQAETVVPGEIFGNVPYAVPDHTRLLLAPGLLASVSGGKHSHTGPPVPVPPTLTPLRVRAPRAGDPSGKSGYRRVIECRDYDRDVLVVTRKADVDLVLGALVSRPPAI